MMESVAGFLLDNIGNPLSAEENRGQKGYSISGDHRRVMEDEYIPKYKKYGKTELPLALFAG